MWRYLAELRRTRPRPVAGAVDSTGTAAAADAVRSTSRSPPVIAGPAPSPRETAWLLRKSDTAPGALRPEERDYVDALCATCPALDRVRSLANDFSDLLRKRESSALEPWLVAAEKSELRAFAGGLGRDHDAVLAAVLFEWSNGQVEGQVQRLKLIKRTMYGRASFDLLRRRVIDAA